MTYAISLTAKKANSPKKSLKEINNGLEKGFLETTEALVRGFHSHLHGPVLSSFLLWLLGRTFLQIMVVTQPLAF